MPYRKPPIMPPWGGWDNSAPALTLPSNSFKQITNWLVNKQRLTPFPKLTHLLQPDNVEETLFGARTFQDANTNFHTMLLNEDRVFFWVSPTVLDQIGAAWIPEPTPYSMEVYQNKVYFCNG